MTTAMQEQLTFCAFRLSKAKRLALENAPNIRKRLKYCPTIDDFLYTGGPSLHYELEHFANIKSQRFCMAYLCHMCRCWLSNVNLGMTHAIYPSLCRSAKSTLDDIATFHHFDSRVTPFSAIRNNLAAVNASRQGHNGILFCPGCPTYVSTTKNCLPHHWAFTAAIGRCPHTHTDPIPGTCLYKPALFHCPDCDSEEDDANALRTECINQSRHTEKWAVLCYMLVVRQFHLSKSLLAVHGGLRNFNGPLASLRKSPVISLIQSYLPTPEPLHRM